MPDSLDQRVAERAARQHGVLTFRQAAELGVTSRQREVRIRTGRWDLRHPGVYAIAGVPRSWRCDLLAACWSASGLAVASHRSAAQPWSLPGGHTVVVEITCH